MNFSLVILTVPGILYILVSLILWILNLLKKELAKLLRTAESPSWIVEKKRKTSGGTRFKFSWTLPENIS